MVFPKDSYLGLCLNSVEIDLLYCQFDVEYYKFYAVVCYVSEQNKTDAKFPREVKTTIYKQ